MTRAAPHSGHPFDSLGSLDTMDGMRPNKDKILSNIRALMEATGGVPGRTENEWSVETIFGEMSVCPIFDFGGSGFIALRFSSDALTKVRQHLGVKDGTIACDGFRLFGRGINCYSGKWNIHMSYGGRRNKANIERAAMWNELLASFEAVLPEPAKLKSGAFEIIDIEPMLGPSKD